MDIGEAVKLVEKAPDTITSAASSVSFAGVSTNPAEWFWTTHRSFWAAWISSAHFSEHWHSSSDSPSSLLTSPSVYTQNVL